MEQLTGLTGGTDDDISRETTNIDLGNKYIDNFVRSVTRSVGHSVNHSSCETLVRDYQDRMKFFYVYI